MKKFILSFLITGILTGAGMVRAQVSINTDGTSPHASAMLEVKSTTRGFLLPRLTTAQRNILSATATAGLVVYDTDFKKIFHYNGSSWDEGGTGNYWGLNGTKVYLNPTTYSLGIGTTNPAKPLEVKGTWQTARFSSADIGAGIELVGSSAINWSINTWADYLYFISSTDQFATKTDQYKIGADYFTPWTNNTKTLGQSSRRWSNFYSIAGDFSGLLTGADATFSGNVGIGTTAPLAKLHVHDPASRNNTVYISPMAASINDSSTLFLSEGLDCQTGMYWLFDGVGNHMELWGKAFGTNYGPHVVVKRDNGDMALGSTFATGYKLSVGGKIICTELRVNQVVDWPDYVFRKDYRLMPIGQLATFIEENGHLPNIPPAAEIEKSGMDMGMMQKRMMEKIEELSLYIINQQKEIDELKSRLENNSR